MSNYRVEFDTVNYLVREIPTDLVLGQFDSSSKAYLVAKRLDCGSGFDSFTPSFFCNYTSLIFDAKHSNILVD